MSWGHGLIEPWGVGPLVETDQPLSEVGGGPTTFLFTDEPNGPLPGLWQRYSLDHDGAGGVAWVAEAVPDTYYRVLDGYGMWQFTRTPPLPGPGIAYVERGVAAGPVGVISGRNSRVSVIARQPLSLVAHGVDEFVWSIGLALRLDPSRSRWVGARMRSVLQAGVWTTPLVLEIVEAEGGEESIIDSKVPDSLPSLLDVWGAQPLVELEVTLRKGNIVASIGGVVELEAQVPEDNFDSSMAVLATAFNRTGSIISPAASLVGVSVQSLRDFARLGPPPQIPGAPHLEDNGSPSMMMPVHELLDQKLIKQVRGRQFQFTQETEVAVLHQTYVFGKGEVIRLKERLGSQDFVPAIRDLNYQRTAPDQSV